VKRKATAPSSEDKFPREADDALQLQELIDIEMDAPWFYRRFFATLASTLRWWPKVK
jgi:hypothetical protein